MRFAPGCTWCGGTIKCDCLDAFDVPSSVFAAPTSSDCADFTTSDVFQLDLVHLDAGAIAWQCALTSACGSCSYLILRMDCTSGGLITSFVSAPNPYPSSGGECNSYNLPFPDPACADAPDLFPLTGLTWASHGTTCCNDKTVVWDITA